MGLIDFAKNFSNSIKSILSSSSGVSYCLFNGVMVATTLYIVNLANIQISDLKLNDHQIGLAVIVGLAGYMTIITKISNSNKGDKEITNELLKAVLQIQKLFFDRFTIGREVKLRPEVAKVMEPVDDNLLIMISDCCAGITINLDEQKGANLAERLLKIHSSTMPIQIKKIEVGLAHVKNIGIDYFRQVVEEFTKTSPLPISIKTVDDNISELQRISQEENSDD
jgi:hypothetical protein